MRRALFVSIRAAVVAIGFASVAHAQASADDSQLRQLIAAHQLASERGDLRGLVDIYSADAEIISTSGKVTRGRDAIEADYRAQLGGAAAKSGRHHTHPVDSIQIRFVSPDVALIDVASVNVGGTGAGGTPMADSRAQLVTIWRKEAGVWKAVYQRALAAQ